MIFRHLDMVFELEYRDTMPSYIFYYREIDNQQQHRVFHLLDGIVFRDFKLSCNELPYIERMPLDNYRIFYHPVSLIPTFLRL